MANASSKLTGAQAAELFRFTEALRASNGQKSKLLRVFVTLDAAYTDTDGIVAILALLASGDVIDDTSGLAGVGQITKADIVASMADAEFDIGKYNNGVQLTNWTRFAGPLNV